MSTQAATAAASAAAASATAQGQEGAAAAVLLPSSLVGAEAALGALCNSWYV